MTQVSSPSQPEPLPPSAAAESSPDSTRPEHRAHDQPTPDLVHAVEQQFTELSQHAHEMNDELNKKTGRNFLAAVIVAIIILAVVGASLFWFNWGFVLVGAVAVVIAECEIAGALRSAKGWQVSLVPVTVGSAVLVLGLYAAHDWGLIPPSILVLWVLGLVGVVVMLWRLRGPLEGYVHDVAASLFLLIYPALLAASLMFILAEPEGSDKLIMFVVAIAAGDTGGHLVGVAFGKHPMAPRISPKKSWEGVVGSYALAIILEILLTVLWLGQPWWKGLVFAAILVTFGIFGDLAESAIKRDLGIKDLGSILPGHGGVMDRVDSYLIAAFPAWILIVWLFPHV